MYDLLKYQPLQLIYVAYEPEPQSQVLFLHMPLFISGSDGVNDEYDSANQPSTIAIGLLDDPFLYQVPQCHAL